MPGTVYILGAGASYFDCAGAGIDIPLAHGFFKPDYLRKYWSMPDQVRAIWEKSHLFKVIGQYFAGRAASSLNIEEVYSFILSSLKNPFLRFWEHSVFQSAEIEMLEYIRNILSAATLMTENPRLVNHLLKHLDTMDTIISFNWDTLIDSAAYIKSPDHPLLKFQSELLQAHHKHSDWYSGKSFGPPHCPAYIKIHGSINLATCDNSSCIHSSIPYRCEPQDEFTDFYRCDNCGHNIKTFLLPPHTAKSYTHNNFVRLQAAIAADRLACADNIVIIGYSFPVFDAEAQSLFRSSRMGTDEHGDGEQHLRSVTLVDPSVSIPEYVERVKDLLGLLDSKRAHGRSVPCITHNSVEAYLAKYSR